MKSEWFVSIILFLLLISLIIFLCYGICLLNKLRTNRRFFFLLNIIYNIEKINYLKIDAY